MVCILTKLLEDGEIDQEVFDKYSPMLEEDETLEEEEDMGEGVEDTLDEAPKLPKSLSKSKVLDDLIKDFDKDDSVGSKVSLIIAKKKRKGKVKKENQEDE